MDHSDLVFIDIPLEGRYTEGKNERLIAAPTNGISKGKKSHLTKWNFPFGSNQD